VPLVIVTVVPLFVQAPLVVITAVVLAFVVGDTLKLEPYGAVSGSPVRPTFGVIFVAIVVWVSVAGLRLLSPGQFAVNKHVPVPLVMSITPVVMLGEVKVNAPSSTQGPLIVIVASSPVLAVASMRKLDLYGADCGASKKLTVCGIVAAATVCVIVAAAQ
jgi:hypothetical protein